MWAYTQILLKGLAHSRKVALSLPQALPKGLQDINSKRSITET